MQLDRSLPGTCLAEQSALARRAQWGSYLAHSPFVLSEAQALGWQAAHWRLRKQNVAAEGTGQGSEFSSRQPCSKATSLGGGDVANPSAPAVPGSRPSSGQTRPHFNTCVPLGPDRVLHKFDIVKIKCHALRKWTCRNSRLHLPGWFSFLWWTKSPRQRTSCISKDTGFFLSLQTLDRWYRSVMSFPLRSPGTTVLASGLPAWRGACLLLHWWHLRSGCVSFSNIFQKT